MSAVTTNSLYGTTKYRESNTKIGKYCLSGILFKYETYKSINLLKSLFITYQKVNLVWITPPHLLES